MMEIGCGRGYLPLEPRRESRRDDPADSYDRILAVGNLYGSPPRRRLLKKNKIKSIG
jgi:hypothetical protein